MYFLSKIIIALLSPLWWVFFCLVISFLWKRKSRLFLGIGLVLFLFFTNGYIINKVLYAIESPYQESNIVSQTQKLNIVVLGGIAGKHGVQKKLSFTDASDRFNQSLLLAHKHKNTRLIFSGGSIKGKENAESTQLVRVALKFGMDSNQVFAETQSVNTYENALYTSQLFEQEAWDKNIVLITSGFHLKRATACFEKQGFTVTPYLTHSLYNYSMISKISYFTPSGRAIYYWELIIKEWFGLWAYRLRGYC